MGAKSEDTDPTPLKGGTEPGLGPKRPNGAPAPPQPPPAKTEPAPVDFDALNAALGDLPQPKGSIPPKAASESEGRSSATYSSARPHTIPPAHEPSDLDAPPVIVASDDTVPTAPPKMTTPIAPAMVAPPISSPISSPISAPGSGNHRVPDPSSGKQPAAAAQAQYPFTPQPFPVQRGVVQPTMKMPERPRRPRSPTVVVRPRGPSKAQKLVVFAAMLVLFLAFATAVAIWRQPGWFNLAPEPAVTTAHPSFSAVAASISAQAATSAPPTSSAPPTASMTSTPSASASSKIPPKKPPFGK